MNLREAIRARPGIQAAIVGAGGKTTAMFQLARQLPPPVFVTTTTHLSVTQASLADQHIILTEFDQLNDFETRPHSTGVILFTGPETEHGRLDGVNEGLLFRLHENAKAKNISVLVEADGSLMLPAKAPATHEPVIPRWIDSVLVISGLSSLEKPLDSNWVHRPELFSNFSGIAIGDPITKEGLVKVLKHPDGGLKNIPEKAARWLVLNQADTPELVSAGEEMAQALLGPFSVVVVGQLGASPDHIRMRCDQVAGIILAAGGASRFGQTKVLLDFHGQPFIRRIAETAIDAGLNPVVAIIGHDADHVRDAIQDLPVKIFENNRWQEGQSTSVIAGINSLDEVIGAAVFFLGDMPQIPTDLVKEIVQTHWTKTGHVITPVVEGRRTNPVLFDREVFGRLLVLQGDSGGRQLMNEFPPISVVWEDPRILLDVDTQEDYKRLLEKTEDE